MTPLHELAAIRFGCGLPQKPRTADQMLDALRGPDVMAATHPVAGMAEYGPLLAEYTQLKRAVTKGLAEPATLQDVELRLRGLGLDGLRATVARALDCEDALRERLVAFWSDHFTVTAPTPRDEARPAAMIEDAIRPHVAGSFAQMLVAVALHPAMLTYLDQAQSIGPNSAQGLRQARGLNENFAREVMELHTLGAAAGYTQDDVRQLAEALTGLTYDARRGVKYDKRRAEPGAETVLGVTYEGERLETVERVLTALAQRPETAAHLARKLAVHFVSDTPDPGLVAALEVAWLQGGGALMPVYEALLAHPAAWQPALAKARQPWDLLMAGMRALGVTGADVRGWSPELLKQAVTAPLINMGQPWRRPRGPDGWREDAEAWITPQGLAARIEWAMTLPQALVRPLPDPVELAQRALGGLASEALLWAVARAEKRAEGVGIVLASAEFNRR